MSDYITDGWALDKMQGQLLSLLIQFLCPSGGKLLHYQAVQGRCTAPRWSLQNWLEKKMVGALSLPVFWAVICLLWSSVWFRRRRGIHSSGPPATPQPFLCLITVTAPNWPSWCLHLRNSFGLFKTVLSRSYILIVFYVTRGKKQECALNRQIDLDRRLQWKGVAGCLIA